MNKYKTIKEAVEAAYEAIAEAEHIADETNEGFSFDVAYAMGGYYSPGEKCEETGSSWFPSSVGC